MLEEQMTIRHIKWWESVLLLFKCSKWAYTTDECYLTGIKYKHLFGHTYILDETREKIC